MSPSIRSVLAHASTLTLQLTLAQGSNSQALLDVPAPLFPPLSGSVQCPIDGPMSCHNSTPIAGDNCCFVYPGGRMLLTQFWDAEIHAGGSDTDWTIHGLWPDLCDGTYDAFCSMTPSYPNITATLLQHNQTDLLSFMTRYWTAAWGSASHLWAHEYNKHGTCINTLSSTCYGEGYKPGVEVVDYFTRAVALFRTLDTYYALERANIVPSRDTRYPLADVRQALEEYSGGKVVLRCSGRGDVLHEAWYVYFVQGSLQSGQFVPAKNLGREGGAGNCKPWVRYLPKRPRRSAEDDDEL
ncbi:ribonuclease T2 family protein [Coniochaeta sp. PMI_546]|nr:ribonuclease T2 family protein [Coniochaeta sp. PMI_546]